MRYILDTSVILSGKNIPLSVDLYIPPGVLDEIKEGGRWYRKLQLMLAAGMKVVTPPGTVIEDVEKHAKKTGDYLRLSSTDIEMIALALYIDATILTDDYSIQNLAKEMGVRYKGVAQEEIKEGYTWKYRCKKCGQIYKEELDECSRCGGDIKTVRYG